MHTIKILKQGLRKNKVLSCSFFTMKDAYRKFDTYKANLKKFIHDANELSDFEIRIYTDDTGAEYAMQISNDNQQVSVYHYNSPEFREGTGHVGVFGAFMRMLPLFEDHEIVWISDIDAFPGYLNPELPKQLIQQNCDVFLGTQVCYSNKDWFHNQYRIYAGHFISRLRFPSGNMTRFLNKVLNDEYAEDIQKINAYNSKMKGIQEKIKFPYSLDEVFIDRYLYPYMQKHARYLILQINYLPMRHLRHKTPITKEELKLLLEYFHKNYPVKMFKQVKHIVEKYLPALLDDYPCLQETYDNLKYLKDKFVINTVIPANEL